MLEKSEYKVYKFDFGNPFKKFISYAVCFLVYITIVFYLYMGLMIFLVSLKNLVDNQLFSRIIAYVGLAIVVLVSVFTMILFFKPRKIILGEQGVYIQRNFFPSAFHINKGFNDYIMYSDIEYCELDDAYKNVFSKISLKLMDPPFISFNNNSLVKIIDKNDTDYYIPVENAENFVAEVNMLMETAQNNTNGKESIND